jgi:tRNA-specific 2-thiouridylase
MKEHIIVGMSGGVDSSVTAALLCEQGYRVTGLFMRNWDADDKDPFCTATQDLTDARAVCDKLNIPLKTVNFAQEYWDRVFQHFLDEYAAGRTPNPDVLCNKEIKFRAFLEHALDLGADAIATGHYARIRTGEHLELLRGVDSNKDQSYFLYTLGQSQLARSRFPLGELSKTAVRAMAVQYGFINHAKKDSTGICFIGERKFQTFLSEYLLAQPGAIETAEGPVIGQHNGLMFYTLGQRQGLGIGGLHNYSEAPWYVVHKDISRNVLVVAQQHDHPLLLNDQLICHDTHWVQGQAPPLPLRCTAKIRYRSNDQACVIEAAAKGNFQVIFDLPQRAITPGQSVVFYQDDVCLGGGIIEARAP